VGQGPTQEHDRRVANAAGKGRVERALERLYERVGSRVVLLTIVGGYAGGIFTLALVVVGGSRYLGLSISQALSLWPIAVVELALGIAGLYPVLGDIRTASAWSDHRGEARAPETWDTLISWRRVPARVVLTASVGLPPAAVVIALHFDRPWYAAPVAVVGVAGAMAGLLAVTAFSADLILRPMLEDVSNHLPAGFEPRAHGLRLRTKAASALPVVTFFSALWVGAYANLLPNGTERAALAVGIALGVVVIATVIFLIINRSVLSPIDDLIAATERVRAGDITTEVPLISDDELGTLTLGFNRMLADLRRHTDELRASRERIVTTADEERRRMERDLHDGAQQELIVARLKLELLDRAIDEDPASARATAGELREDLDRALAQLRDLAHGLYPPLLESDGLPGALQEAVGRAAIPTELDCDGAGRYRPDLEAAVYFCCLEALQNAAKHAGPRARATVRVAERDRDLRFEVADDGRGFEPAGGRSGVGLQNMTDRIGALGGELRIESIPGEGTRVSGEVPVTS
jgi:signal transduction histidine kinase